MSFHFEKHHPIFHVREGLSFRRRPTGEVRIELNGSFLYLTEHEWASIVAFLSRDGENAETFKAALDFYNEPSEGSGAPLPEFLPASQVDEMEIEERRSDPEFRARLERSIEENRELLERLGVPSAPLPEASGLTREEIGKLCWAADAWTAMPITVQGRATEEIREIIARFNAQPLPEGEKCEHDWFIPQSLGTPATVGVPLEVCRRCEATRPISTERNGR
jgi:hypothetical protein